MTKHDPIKNPTKGQLRSLRSAYKKLRQKGIRLDKASPSKVKLTAAMRKKIVALRGVVQGKASVLTISRTPVSSKKEAIKAHKQAGRLVIGDKLILPKKKRAVAFVDKRGFPTVRTKAAAGLIERVIIPIPYTNLRQWITDVKKSKELEKLRAPNERWAFQFFGGNSHGTFGSLKELLEWFSTYHTVEDAKSAKDMRDIFEHLEIIRVQQAKDLWHWNHLIEPYWRGPRSPHKRRVYHRNKYGESKWQAQRRRMKERSPERYKAYLAKDRQRKQARKTEQREAMRRAIAKSKRGKKSTR